MYFLYWTAIAAPDGAVGFRGDLYGRDARLIAALAEPAPRAASSQAWSTNAPESRSGRVSNTLLPAIDEPRVNTEPFAVG